MPKLNGKAWRPTLADLELIAEASHARLPIAVLAGKLGGSEVVFTAWARRLAAAKEPPEPEPDFDLGFDRRRIFGPYIVWTPDPRR